MFYTFKQNNSHGRWDEDENLAEYVIVEARTAGEANTRARFLGVYFDPDYHTDCPCCGTRWNEADESDASPFPEIYGKDVSSGRYEMSRWELPWTQVKAYVHNLDGGKTTVRSHNDES